MAVELEHPEIDFLILADRAEAVNGKLYMMGGGWDRLHIVDFNQPVPFSFAVGVLIPWNSANEMIQLTISLEDEDHNKVVPDLAATVNQGRPPHAIPGQWFRAILSVQGVWKLPKPGGYVLRASLAGRDKIEKFYAIPAVPLLPVSRVPPGTQGQ